jgi:hypothetical protein
MLGTFFEDHRHRCQRNHVVHNRRLAHKAFQRRQGWLGADDAAFAFKAVQQAGFLATDIGPRTDADFHIKGIARAQNRRAQNAFGTRDVHRLLHHADRDGVFRTNIHKALGRTRCQSGNHHAFDEGEGVALHQHPVCEGGAIALIGVADDIFAVSFRLGDGFPLDAGGEARATTAAQARGGHFGHNRSLVHPKRAGQAGQTALGFVIIQGKRIDHADAGKGQAGLGAHPRQIIGQTQRLGVGRKVAQQGRNIRKRQRAKGQSAFGRFHLGHRFQPNHPTRAIANDC